MTTVLQITFGLLALAGLLTLVRLVRGPTSCDRLVALDTLVVLVISSIAVEGALAGDGVNVIILVVVALVGFLSTVAVLRLMPEDLL